MVFTIYGHGGHLGHVVKDLGFGWMFNGIFRGFTIMSSLCKCLSHFTLF